MSDTSWEKAACSRKHVYNRGNWIELAQSQGQLSTAEPVHNLYYLPDVTIIILMKKVWTAHVARIRSAYNSICMGCLDSECGWY